MNFESKIMRSLQLLCTSCIVMLFCSNVFAQKTDTTQISFKPKSKVVSRVPTIKANIQPYRPSQLSYTPSGSSVNSTKNLTLTILKIYPNPVNDQLNINLRLGKETMLSIKLTDMLGNDVINFLNERVAAGEQTKTFNIPSKLNTGIYFLRVVAGGEPLVRRISVL